MEPILLFEAVTGQLPGVPARVSEVVDALDVLGRIFPEVSAILDLIRLVASMVTCVGCLLTW
jgi:hypothetical protein